MEKEPILKSTTFGGGECLKEIREVARVNQIIHGMKLALWFLRKKRVERQRERKLQGSFWEIKKEWP